MLIKGATGCIANLSSPHLKVHAKSGGMSPCTYCWDYRPGILVPYGYPIFKCFSVDGLKVASSIIVSIMRATVRSLLLLHRGGDQTSAGLSGVTSISNRSQIRVFNPGESPYESKYSTCHRHGVPESKVHEANMGLIWVLTAPDGPDVGPMNLAIRGVSSSM